MNTYRAAWLCPIAQAPIRHGWVAIRDGRIAAIGAEADPPPTPPTDLGDAAILPGLVNAHTHLELSWLRDRVPPAASFVDWIKQLFLTRGGRSERPGDAKVTDAARNAAREMRESGTAAVGDISNSLATVEAIQTNGMLGLVFHELLGFNLTNGQSVADTRPLRAMAARFGAGAVRVSVAPHAPYSVSPELFRAIREEVDGSDVPITSVHLGESESEVDFLRDGSGPWPGILKWVGSEREGWRPPGLSPVAYLDGLGVIDAGTLIVHAVQMQDADLRRLAEIGCTVVTCPRSNQWVGVGMPPIARFYAAGVKVAVGTDSLASVGDLNLFAELHTMRWLAPSVPARTLLASATRVGAEALGLGDELGTIEVGKRAELIAVTLPATWAGPSAAQLPRTSAAPRSRDGDPEHAGDSAGAFDIEEYLVGGITPDKVQWVSS
jgi:cytosine/adenosine deaminase-related metal-dependent hydrolase